MNQSGSLVISKRRMCDLIKKINTFLKARKMRTTKIPQSSEFQCDYYFVFVFTRF